MALTKKDLVESIVKKGIERKKAERIIENLVESIKSALVSGDDVLITRFGKFCIKEKGRRKGRNPATGDDLMLNARKIVTFKCSSALRNKLN